MWAGLRHSIPINLKLDTSQNFLAPSPNFKIKNNTFDVTEKKSRDYYILLISNKAQFPSAAINFPFIGSFPFIGLSSRQALESNTNNLLSNY